jgi:hypothetical protein
MSEKSPVPLFSTLCCSLILLLLGGYVYYITLGDDECHSKWWPRVFAIGWILQGLCLISITFLGMKGLSKDNQSKQQ